jgi:hypothetical protein
MKSNEYILVVTVTCLNSLLLDIKFMKLKLTVVVVVVVVVVLVVVIIVPGMAELREILLLVDITVVVGKELVEGIKADVELTVEIVVVKIELFIEISVEIVEEIILVLEITEFD